MSQKNDNDQIVPMAGPYEDIYTLDGWKQLTAENRIGFILVLEDVRAGSMLHIPLRKWTYETDKEEESKVLSVLEKTALSYIDGHKVYFISKEQTYLDDLDNGRISLGEFLGYPRCCVKKFDKMSKKILKGKGIPAGLDYWQKAKKCMEKGRYNDILDYALHFPCSPKCAKSAKLVQRIKNVLERYDPKAAQYIRENNRHNINSVDLRTRYTIHVN